MCIQSSSSPKRVIIHDNQDIERITRSVYTYVFDIDFKGMQNNDHGYFPAYFRLEDLIFFVCQKQITETRFDLQYSVQKPTPTLKTASSATKAGIAFGKICFCENEIIRSSTKLSYQNKF